MRQRQLKKTRFEKKFKENTRCVKIPCIYIYTRKVSETATASSKAKATGTTTATAAADSAAASTVATRSHECAPRHVTSRAHLLFQTYPTHLGSHLLSHITAGVTPGDQVDIHYHDNFHCRDEAPHTQRRN